MRLSYLILAALLPCALSQDTTTTTTDFVAATTSDSGFSTSTSSSPAFTTTIAVGKANHAFEPNVVQVPVGGFVEFDFYPTNHSVIRAEYLYPCVPYELTGIGKVGFYSGQQPVDAILTDPPKWTLQVNDSDPIFFYCGAPNSCIGFQMVGVINPNATTLIEVQKEYAANSSFMLLPGQPWPSEEDPFATTSTSTATAVTTTSVTSTIPPTAATTTAAPTATAESSESHKTALSTGAIAGIAIGGAAVLVLAAGLLFFCGRRSKNRAEPQTTAPTTPAIGPTMHPPAYMPLNANYGYMSPTNKHMSMTSAATDAFGNPIQNGSGMYGYPGGYPHPQGYAPPQMTQMQPQPSPSNDIFGPLPPSVQGGTDTHPNTEAHSLRASSPSSMHAAAPAPVLGGIEAFLQRQGRMSPQPDNGGMGGGGNEHRPPGPYEMSASGTHMR